MNRKKLISILMSVIMLAALFTGITVNPATAKAEDGLVLHLKFDHDLTDASGNGNDGESAYGNIAWSEGVFGDSAYFDGKNYVEIKDNDSLDLETFTISFWAWKLSTLDKENKVPYIYKEEDEASWASPYCIYEFGDNLPFAYLHDNSGDTELNQFRVEGRSVDISKWFLMTVTYDGSEVRIYEDGQLIKKESVTGFPSKTTGNLYIGMMEGEYFLKGLIDDLRIYNRALSAKEVTGLYNEGLKACSALTQTDKLVGYYKFNDNYDDSAQGHTAELAAGDVSFVDGMSGKAAVFGDGAYLETEYTLDHDFDEGFTATAWVNLKDGSDWNMLLYKGGVSTSANSNDYAYCIYLYDDCYEFNYIPFGYQSGKSGLAYSTDSSIVNSWKHIAVTFDTKEIRWYINGKLVKKEEVSEEYKGNIAHSSGKLMIGSDGEYNLTGAIDELKLFNYPLSAKEIETESKRIDSLKISDENQNSIKGLKAKASVTLETTRYYYDSGKSAKLTSGVKYKSSNKKVFTVDSKGVIKAVKKGSATLTITHGGISKTYKVTVK